MIRGRPPERVVGAAGDHRPARKGRSAGRRDRRTQSTSLVDGASAPPTSAPRCRSLRLRNQSSSPPGCGIRNIHNTARAQGPCRFATAERPPQEGRIARFLVTGGPGLRGGMSELPVPLPQPDPADLARVAPQGAGRWAPFGDFPGTHSSGCFEFTAGRHQPSSRSLHLIVSLSAAEAVLRGAAQDRRGAGQRRHLRPVSRPDRDRAALAGSARAQAAREPVHAVRAEQRMSQTSEQPWISTAIPYGEMPRIRARLLQGDSRNAIAKEYNVSGRWVSSCVLEYLLREGIPIEPGITRRRAPDVARTRWRLSRAGSSCTRGTGRRWAKRASGWRAERPRTVSLVIREFLSALMREKPSGTRRDTSAAASERPPPGSSSRATPAPLPPEAPATAGREGRRAL